MILNVGFEIQTPTFNFMDNDPRRKFLIFVLKKRWMKKI